MSRRLTTAAFALTVAISACTTATQTVVTPSPSDCALSGEISNDVTVTRDDSRCSGADLSTRKFSDLSAPGGEFEHADFAGVTLIDVDMRGSNFAGADFTDATLTRVDWEDANLTGVNLAGAKVADLSIGGARRCNTVRANGTVDNASCPPGGDTSRAAHTSGSRAPEPRAAGISVSVDAFSVNGGRSVDCDDGGVKLISAGWTTSGDVTDVLIDVDSANVASALAPNGNTQLPFDCAQPTHSYDLTAAGPDQPPAGAGNYVTVTTSVRAD